MKTVFNYKLEKPRKTLKRTCDVCNCKVKQGECFKLIETRDTLINNKLQQTTAGCIEPKFGHEKCLMSIKRV